MITANRSRRTLAIGLLLAVLLALALRCPQLGVRPMHNDEAVNAIKLRDLWQRGSYQYNPLEYHGPTLLYLELAWVKLIRAADFVQLTESQLRFLPVLFGAGLILLLPLVADGLGRRATICAALLTAVSPAMVFYSRYFIHEMLLVFFTFLTLAGAWRYWQNPRPGWALLAGAGAGLMQATKETFVFSLAALAAALAINSFLSSQGQKSGDIPIQTLSARVPFKLNYFHAGAAILIWLLVVVVLFSSFFTNASGVLDSVRTYLPWLHRVEGASPHIHPWSFYLRRLAWFHPGRGPIYSEGLILGLALLGMGAAFTRRGIQESNPAFVRILAFYTISLTVIYSVISYKTPWCLLSFWQGMILLAGAGVVALMNLLRRRALQVMAGALLLAGAGQLAAQAWRAAITDSAHPRNPYVYAQTSPDILDLVGHVKAFAQFAPQPNETVIEVVAPESEYWPLPWYLRQFKRVGWWDAPPTNVNANILILSTKTSGDFDAGKSYVPMGLFELRPRTFFGLYVRGDLARDYMAKRAEELPGKDPKN